MNDSLPNGGKKASKRNVYIIFTPSKDFTADQARRYFKSIDRARLEFELIEESEAETPKVISPLGVARGKNDVETILSALQESLELELLA
jgi:hypothetical protein